MYYDVCKIDVVNTVLHVRSELRKPCSAYEDAKVFTCMLPNIPYCVLLDKVPACRILAVLSSEEVTGSATVVSIFLTGT